GTTVLHDAVAARPPSIKPLVPAWRPVAPGRTGALPIESDLRQFPGESIQVKSVEVGRGAVTTGEGAAVRAERQELHRPAVGRVLEQLPAAVHVVEVDTAVVEAQRQQLALGTERRARPLARPLARDAEDSPLLPRRKAPKAKPKLRGAVRA